MGCNAAKSCCSTEEFRRWCGGGLFYCEQIVGERFPVDDLSRVGDGKFRMHLTELVDERFNKLRVAIGNRFHSRDLIERLDSIIQEARGKVLR